ncbi:uncharacterized protein LY89DRAFT_586667 [Mollisia scopiformis]|uniref:Integral membrane protein n=1 Tax=Mollisia scopiformis TaxID=149040 RepID=A0A194X8F9_MOLSC|nr:uncharacterized protein LY89DRAFT_586667 [Mollisia scopiformis]KUJ16453.1 hypothetical protein LY89DRAFT_586667 [Mollisia scopiformis]
MAQQPPPQPSSSTTENPIVAVGRKVKSILSSHQRPSVRILRESSSTSPHRRSQAQPSAAHSTSYNAPPIETSFGDAQDRTSARKRSFFGREKGFTDDNSYENEYDQDTVDLLDVMVSTLSTLTNVQNSLFVPSLGKLINRRPTYRISERPEEARTIDKLKNLLKNIPHALKEDDEGSDEAKPEGQQPSMPWKRTIPAPPILFNAQYAILPDGERLEGWTNEEKEELDDRVRHMLHSRRAKFKRSLKGFRQYVRRPFGLFITVYATLITLFGAAWVLFLIGWISVGSKKDYVVNVVDNVLVALFAIIGDGLAPFRAVDTYHMAFIAHYHRKTLKKRKKLGLPELADHNDLPDQRKENVKPAEFDLESLVARRMPRRLARRIAPRIPKKYAQRMIARSKIDDPAYEYSVLTEEQQAKLEYHERKFSKSHTFYKPHETETHYAFPFKLLIAVVVLLDFHSALQITLGACTWGIPYETRPFALTTVVLCCSITCNIMGGVLISMGDKRTRKKDVIERMMVQQLTSEAIEEMETRRLKELEERGVLDPAVRKRLEDQKEEAENEEVKKSWKSVPSLPKKLLGKGEDHRQPSLPQEARRSSADVDSPTSPTKKSKSNSNVGLPSLQEDASQPSRPKPALMRGEEPPKQSTGQKVMGFIRKADMDRS